MRHSPTQTSTWLLTLGLALFAAACEDDPQPTAPVTGDLVAVASADTRLSTVVSLIERAGLVGALQGDGPFTAFLPINGAFDGVDAAAISDSELSNILQRHVVAGRFDAAAVVAASDLTALNGDKLTIVVDGGAVSLNGAGIVETDIAARNGVIHLVDAIIPPPTPEVEQPGNIAEIAAATAELSTLVQLATQAGVVDLLASPGPFTVFAPTNAAFDEVPQALLDALAEDVNLLRLVLAYHVSPGAFDAAAVVTQGSLTTLAEQDLPVDTSDGVRVGGARVTTVDIEASNGFVHIIDAVLVPELPSTEPGTIAEVATANGNFTTLLAAVEAAGLTAAVADPDANLTVFAPTDAAFAQIPEADLQALLADVPALTAVLTGHVVPGRFSAEEVIAAMTLTPISGATLVVENTPEGVRINGALVIISDVPASNGIIHAIDAVILPPPAPTDIIGTAERAGSFSTLLAAVEAAELTDALRGEGPLTVFAPTDAAFAALPAGTVETLLAPEAREQLVDILTYHVFAGRLGAAEVIEASLVTMLNGVRAKVEVTDEGVFIAGARVSVTDIEATNGTIHVIDAVMMPPGDIAAVAEANGSFTTLLAAVGASGLVDALTGDDELTVFAPTDAAFAALPEGTVEALLADPTALASILTYHVVAGGQAATDVIEGGRFATLNGYEVFARITDDGVFINEAQIVMTDIPARNGIIHVIDAVILPPEHIVDVAADGGVFTTLIAAAGAAGLADALTAPDANLAVFAPTDAAFDALPEGTVEALLADPATLADILLYHVVAGAPDAARVVANRYLVTAQGAGVNVQIEGGVVRIGDARIVMTDIPAPNGVIHVIDAVMLPPPDLITVAEQAGNFSTLLAAIDAAGLTDALRGAEGLTVFAPTDDAFAALPEGTVQMLLNDLPTLTTILQYHVVEGFQFSGDVVVSAGSQTLAGSFLPYNFDGARVSVGGATVIQADIFAGNGVIHALESVIALP